MTHAVLARLRAFMTGTAVEACDLCAESISAEHQHLLEREARRVLCTCEACAERSAAASRGASARYLRVQRCAQRLLEVDIDARLWTSFDVPSSLAFFTVRCRSGEVVATFPGRSGIIESFVPIKTWSELERRCPSIKSIAPDVEALLVRRTARQQDYFRASIDHCYELVELWRALGTPFPSPELPAIQAFFTRLESARERHSRRPGA